MARAHLQLVDTSEPEMPLEDERLDDEEADTLETEAPEPTLPASPAPPPPSLPDASEVHPAVVIGDVMNVPAASEPPPPADAALVVEEEPEEPIALAGMRVTVSVHQGRLCVLALSESRWGAVPIACHVALEERPQEGAVPEGPVDLRAPQHPAVLRALSTCERKLAMAGKREAFELAIENLVRRARLGDQNAMAMIAMVRERADKGVVRARQAHAALLAYAQSHAFSGLIGPDATMAGERLSPGALRASSSLANGPLLTRARILEIAATLGEDQAKALLFGCAHFREPKVLTTYGAQYPESQGAFQAGAAIGSARAIQMLRVPGASLGRFSPMVAWELGESS